MKPEPRDFDSKSRGAPCGRPWRRKNSKKGSSSGILGIPGIARVPMLGAWTVLIFTTAEPSLSTSSVKLGKSPGCAQTEADNPSNATRKNLNIILCLQWENKSGEPSLN